MRGKQLGTGTKSQTTAQAGRQEAPARPRTSKSAPAPDPEPEPQLGPESHRDGIDAARVSRAAAIVRGDRSATGAGAVGEVAEAAPVETLRSMEQARELVTQLVQERFPELEGKNIVVEPFASDGDYFRSTVSTGSLFRFGGWKYRIQVNPRLFERELPVDAARGILTHELCHTVDFSGRSSFGMAGVGLKYMNESSETRFERGTDLEAIARGAGDELAGYRRWLYDNVDSATVARKKRVYFTPPEIEAVSAALSRRPELLTSWRADVPLSMAEIESEN